jgi:phosphoglycolate phosphatase
VRPPNPIRAVVFDWDGTLADTAEATYCAYLRTFAEFGIPYDRAEYERTYSPNWYRTFLAVGLPQERWPDADAKWLACFAEESVSLHTGTREFLDALEGRRIARAIVTSGGRERVTRELVAHGIDGRFAHVVGGDEVTQRKPHPEAMHLCLERLGVAAGEAVYVGDSPEDVLMARAAGVFAVAVAGGYPNRRALAAAEPDLFADDLPKAMSLLLDDDA